MKVREVVDFVGRPTVITLCGYEVVAMSARGHGHIPTLTTLVHRHRSSWRGRIVIGLLFGWLIFHLFAPAVL